MQTHRIKLNVKKEATKLHKKNHIVTQSEFTCSKLAIETDVKYVQS